MATPNIDTMSVQLSARIADVVQSASDNGKSVSSVERMAILNSAMLKLFDELWMVSKGDIEAFIKICPELYVSDIVQTTIHGIYNVTTGNKLKDMFTPVSALSESNEFIKQLPTHLYPIIKSDKYDDFGIDSNNPIFFNPSGLLVFFPTADFNTKNTTIFYIKVPLNPTTGAFLIQGGTYDSPFSSVWNGKIVDIAEDIYRTIAQEKGQ